MQLNALLHGGLVCSNVGPNGRRILAEGR